MSKSVGVQQYATLVSENEWLEWQRRPNWIPCRGVFTVNELNDWKKIRLRKENKNIPSTAEGRLFFAIFVLPNDLKKYQKGLSIPFYCVVGVLVIKESDLILLRTRYGSDELFVEKLNIAAEKGISQVICHQVEEEMRDSGKFLLEIFDIDYDCHKDGIFPIESLLPTSNLSDEGRLLSYTRHVPNFPNGLLGAVCDLGKILRELPTTDKNDVTKFAAAVGNIVKSHNEFNLGDAQSLVEKFKGIHPFVKLDVLIYLYWKYRAGECNGHIDFCEIKENLKMSREVGVEDACIRALVTLGQFSGFDCFAANYHAAMREKMNRSISGKNLETSSKHKEEDVCQRALVPIEHYSRSLHTLISLATKVLGGLKR